MHICNFCGEELTENNSYYRSGGIYPLHCDNEECIKKHNKIIGDIKYGRYRPYSHDIYFKMNTQNIIDRNNASCSCNIELRQIRIEKINRNKPYRRMIHSIRARIRQGIKNKYKSFHSVDLLGCSYEYAYKHIEKQFVEGMSWANYGKWHIDHIRPISSFNFADSEQQKQCFHYTNLQPLWAEDNLAKSDHWTP